MNISSLTTHTLNIQTNYKLSKIDPNTPLQQIKQGEHIDSNYYKSHYGDINYYTKTYTKTKEESLDNFMVGQTLSILNVFYLKQHLVSQIYSLLRMYIKQGVHT